MVLPYYHLQSDQVETFLKKPCFPETVIPASQWVGTASSDDNMVQQRNIHRGRRLAKLARELDIGSIWRWIPTGVVV